MTLSFNPVGLARSVLFGLALVFTTGLAAQDAPYNPIDVRPNPPALNEPIIMEWVIRCADGGYQRGGGISLNQLRVNLDPDTIDVSISAGATDPQSLSCVEEYYAYTLYIGTISDPGDYLVSIFNDGSIISGEQPFDPEHLISRFELKLRENPRTYNSEVPRQASIQSGVGLIRGWVCDAGLVEVQIDNGARKVAAYGLSREDTRATCGDADNGYALITTWSQFGLGQHTAKLIVDDVVVSEVEFEVAGFEGGFMKGLEGEFELFDFPSPGESVVVRWDEPSQNFIIVEHVKE